MRGQPASLAFNKVRLGFGIVCVSFLAIAGAGAAYATPLTRVGVEAFITHDFGPIEKDSGDTGHGLIVGSESVEKSFSDGSLADATE